MSAAVPPPDVPRRFPDRRRPPRARDRMLGAQLRALRLRYGGLSLERAAERSQLSLATLSRMENGRRHITCDEVAMLLGIYGVPRRLRDTLVDTARSGFQDGVWQSEPQAGHASDEDGITVLESAAHRVTDWSITTVPPLLQTPAYSRAQLLDAGVADLDRHLAARLRRQEAISRLDYTAYIHEGAFHTHNRTPVYRDQLTHLLTAAERGIGVRLVPAGTPVHSLGHPWQLLEFPDDPPVVHLRLRHVGLYLHEPEAAAYGELRDHLRRIARTTRDSCRLLSSWAT